MDCVRPTNKAADLEKQLLKDRLSELTLENMRLSKRLGNETFLRRRLDAVLAERDEYKRRALAAESELKHMYKEVLDL